MTDLEDKLERSINLVQQQKERRRMSELLAAVPSEPGREPPQGMREAEENP